MYCDFDQLPDSSQIWIFQADRLLDVFEIDKCAQFLIEKLSNWASHGTPLTASFKFEYNRFIIIAVDSDQNSASGCSIDTSNRWIKELQLKLNIDFFDRSLAFLVDNKINNVSIFGIKNQILSNSIMPETMVFDNTIASKLELKNNWILKAKESHLARYF
jgi:hypothetical protein